MCTAYITFEQFEMDGCDNCDEYLHMKNSTDAVYDCTSSNFDGMVAMMGPEDSWVAKWQRVERFTKGCYALSVTGRLPPESLAGISKLLKLFLHVSPDGVGAGCHDPQFGHVLVEIVSGALHGVRRQL
ncbi:SPT4H-like protein [Mya arenaria]|uniref:SPT4H-like protein n=1 Tax=Mya arenaria TaxID=6604 RepID=A0ABY7E0W7_MYAAR|nr:SPT4H-like protein [Mya arenaria]